MIQMNIVHDDINIITGAPKAHHGEPEAPQFIPTYLGVKVFCMGCQCGAFHPDHIQYSDKDQFVAECIEFDDFFNDPTNHDPDCEEVKCNV